MAQAQNKEELESLIKANEDNRKESQRLTEKVESLESQVSNLSKAQEKQKMREKMATD